MIKYRLVAVLAYSIGVGMGVLATRRYYRDKYEQIMQQDRMVARHFMNEGKKQKAKYERKLKKEAKREEVEVVEDGNPYNLTWDSTELDYEAEAKHRTNDAPYVISKDEYDYDKPHFAKADMEYYREDNALVDDRVDPYTDIDELVGDANLKRFGHGSGDRRLVYIRNEELETDFEVRLMMGSYKADFLGLDDPSDEGKRWKPPPR